MATYAAKTAINADNRVTRDQAARSLAQQYATCLTTNDRRAEAKVIAEGDVKNDQDALDGDRAGWEAIDKLFPHGFPEPAWTTIQEGLDRRQANITAQLAKIDDTYEPSDCEALLGGKPDAEDTTSGT